MSMSLLFAVLLLAGIGVLGLVTAVALVLLLVRSPARGQVPTVGAHGHSTGTSGSTAGSVG